MAVRQSQRRFRGFNGENWVQFALRDPETEATELGALETSFRLKRGWNVEGAANVYLRGKATLAGVGRHAAYVVRLVDGKAREEAIEGRYLGQPLPD